MKSQRPPAYTPRYLLGGPPWRNEQVIRQHRLSPWFRHFKVDRIRKVTALDRRFTPQSGFSVEKHFAHSLGVYRAQEPVAFRIWFSAKAAAWVREEPWHPKQQVELRECGDLVLTLPAAYEDEIVPRVLGLGAEAEILAPESARRKVAAVLQALMPNYQSTCNA